MAGKIDVLFITHLRMPRDSGSASVYRPLRLEIMGQPAALPILRLLARGGDPAPALQAFSREAMLRGSPPVLTPIYLQDYMRRRGLSLVEIPCLETGMPQVQQAVARGVNLIALCTTWQADAQAAMHLRQAAAQLRAAAPGVPLIAGGVGVRKGLKAMEMLRGQMLPGVPAEALANLYLLIRPDLDNVFDAIVVSEGGEATLAAIANRLRDGNDFRDLPNLALPKGDHYDFTPTEPETTELDDEGVDWSRYSERIRGFEAPIRTAVGCPFRCEFCDFAGLYTARQRATESILAELRTLGDALPAPRRVFFTDDNIALTQRRLEEFARALIDARLGLSWRAFCRADAIDESTAALMKESGCRECLLGIESGDPGILRNMNKRLDLDRAVSAVRLLDANGIGTQCTFVVGFPGECAATIERTAQFISALPSGASARALHRYYMFRFVVLPLCPAAGRDQRIAHGLSGIGENWAHRTMNSVEAEAAVRELFLKARGPSHMYLEFVPQEWPLATTRRIMELRDAIQKDRLNGADTDGEKNLLAAVREADAIPGAGSAGRQPPS